MGLREDKKRSWSIIEGPSDPGGMHSAYLVGREAAPSLLYDPAAALRARRSPPGDRRPCRSSAGDFGTHGATYTRIITAGAERRIVGIHLCLLYPQPRYEASLKLLSSYVVQVARHNSSSSSQSRSEGSARKMDDWERIATCIPLFYGTMALCLSDLTSDQVQTR